MPYDSNLFHWSRSTNMSTQNYYATKIGARSAKADQPFLSTTTGVHNVVYGAGWNTLFEMEYNNFGVLREYDWPRSGFRVAADEILPSTDNGNTVEGAVSEAGAVPESSRPNITPISIEIKTVDRKVDISTVQQILANTGDDVAVTFEYARNWTAERMLKAVGEMISRDVEADAAAASSPYTSSQRLETWDRIISSKAEADALNADSTNKHWYSPYNNAYDRDTVTTFDSKVLTASPSKTIGGANGPLTPELIQKAIYETGSESQYFPDVIVCSWGLLAHINNIYSGYVRTQGENVSMYTESRYEFGENGIVPSAPGTKAGYQVASIQGIPVVGTARAVKRASDGTEEGRMFLLTTRSDGTTGRPMMGYARALPLTYYSIDVLTDPAGPLRKDKHVSEALFTMMGEVVCTMPTAQGKIRDISVI